MTVKAEKRHAIACFHSRVTQRSRKTPHTIAELGISKPPVLTHHRGFAGKLLFRVAKKSYWRQGNIHESLTRRSGLHRPPARARSRRPRRPRPGRPPSLSSRDRRRNGPVESSPAANLSGAR